MRMRGVVAALATATLLACLPAAPTSAGTGYSTVCDGGDVVLTRPVTVAAMTLTSGENTKVWVCYSTTPSGTPGGQGGAFHLDIWRNPTATHGLYVAVACYPDGAGDFCAYANRVAVASSDLGNPLVSSPGECVAYNATTCVVRLPADVVVTLNGDPSKPLVWVEVLNRSVTADAPVRCLSLLAPC